MHLHMPFKDGTAPQSATPGAVVQVQAQLQGQLQMPA